MHDLFTQPATPPYQPRSQTSREAAERIKPTAGTLMLVVYHAISGSVGRGLTDEEGIRATNLSPSTYRPRRCELVAAGRIRDSGVKRPTSSGRKAVVWVAV